MTFSQVFSSATPQAARNVALMADGRSLTDISGVTSFRPNTAPGNPTWQATQPIQFTQQPRVDVGGDTLAVFRLDQAIGATSNTPRLFRYAPSSATPVWSYSFPLAVNQATTGMHVSRDGQTIVAWCFTFQAKAAINESMRPPNGMVVDIAVFRPGVSAPISYSSLYMAGDPKMSALSADGSTLLIVSNIMRATFKTATAAVTLAANMTINGTCCAISADGSAYAISRGQQHVDVFGARAFVYDSGDTDAGCGGLALSDDGKTMATAWSMGSPYTTVEVRAIDAVSKAEQYRVGISGATGLRNEATALGMSADGSVVAVGTTGDGAGNAPNLMIFESGTPSLSKDIPLSVMEIDVSPDGQYVAAATRSLHVYQGGNATGTIELYKRGAGVPPPVNPTEYRATIPYPAVQGSVHSAVAIPPGSGSAIQVRVL